MKALVYADYGDPLTLVDVPEPTCGSDQVRLQVHASSVNPIDWKLHSGALRFLRPIPRPAVPGLDVVGTVLESKASGFAVGDRVVARLGDVPGGAAAEQCVAGADVSVLAPAGLDTAELAALPLAGMTALQGLRDDCGLRMEGDDRRVLGVGASGGVGHYAVQPARIAGAHVTAVCSGKRAEMVRELGADHVIDYRERDDFVSDAPYDIVIDCAAKAPWARFREVMAPGSHLSQPTPNGGWMLAFATSAFTSKKAHFTMLKANASDLGILVDHMQAGRLRSVVGRTFPWTELAAAWEVNKKGGTAGKIALET